MKNNIKLKHKLAYVAIALTPSSLFASSSGGGLAWEGPIQQVTDSLTGPVATTIGALAFFVAGGMLIFGSEIGDFAKRVLYAVLAASLMIFGTQILAALGLSGTII